MSSYRWYCCNVLIKAIKNNAQKRIMDAHRSTVQYGTTVDAQSSTAVDRLVQPCVPYGVFGLSLTSGGINMNG